MKTKPSVKALRRSMGEKEPGHAPKVSNAIQVFKDNVDSRFLFLMLMTHDIKTSQRLVHAAVSGRLSSDL